MSYTKEMTEFMVQEYQNEPTRATVDRLSEKFEKSVKSIIGKLSREGVYRREVYTTKTGDKPVTKVELAEEIAVLLELEFHQVAGLEKAPKQALKAIVAGLKSAEDME
jgi:hypothetical protein